MAIIRSRFVSPAILASLAFSSEGCRVVGGIFKAGMFVGVLAVVLVLAAIIWGIRLLVR